jgi:cobalt-zinc-cadmium efflux system outer membrane protein
MAIAKEMLDYEKAQRIPDLEVTAGYVSNGGKNDTWTAGLAFPLPIFNFNQGHICKAEHLLHQAYDRKQQSAIDLQIALTAAFEDLRAAYGQGLSFKEHILRVAEEAFEGAQEGYRVGKQDHRDFLEAQRTLFETQAEYIETLVEYHKKKADVERLVGSCGI